MINIWKWPLGGPTDCEHCGGIGIHQYGLDSESLLKWSFYSVEELEGDDDFVLDPFCGECEAGDIARKRALCRICSRDGAQFGPLGLECGDPFYCHRCARDRSLRSSGSYSWEILPCIRCGKRGMHGPPPRQSCGCKTHHLPEITGRIYFWEVGGFTKIGFTSRKTTKRLRELSTGAAHQGRLVHEIDGCLADERFLHGYYREQRVRGEWFDLRLSMFCEQPSQLKRCPFCGGWCPMAGWDFCPASEAATRTLTAVEGQRMNEILGDA